MLHNVVQMYYSRYQEITFSVVGGAICGTSCYQTLKIERWCHLRHELYLYADELVPFAAHVIVFSKRFWLLVGCFGMCHFGPARNRGSVIWLGWSLDSRRHDITCMWWTLSQYQGIVSLSCCSNLTHIWVYMVPGVTRLLEGVCVRTLIGNE